MKGKNVVILHNQVTTDSPKDELDVLVQAEEVSKSLSELGYRPVTVPFSLDLEKNIRAIKKIDPLFVFNLVESVEGNGQLIHLAPALLDHLEPALYRQQPGSDLRHLQQDPEQENAAAGRNRLAAVAVGREPAGSCGAGRGDLPVQIGLGARIELVR